MTIQIEGTVYVLLIFNLDGSLNFAVCRPTKEEIEGAKEGWKHIFDQWHEEKIYRIITVSHKETLEEV